MLALPPPELGSAVAVALGVGVRLGSLRHAGQTTAGRAMRSGSSVPRSKTPGPRVCCGALSDAAAAGFVCKTRHAAPMEYARLRV